MMPGYETLLFYKYVPIADAPAFTAEHLDFCRQLGIRGRVLIADEGINGTVSGTAEQMRHYRNHLHADERFADMPFKIDVCDGHTFEKLQVRYRKEIVHFGVSSIDVENMRGTYIEPHEFVQMKDEPDVVVVDFRNRVEWEVGRFRNAVVLPIDRFRQVPECLPLLEPYKHRRIVAYCTGGIRCEKATAFLRSKGFEQVYQLHGGIIEYGKQVGGKDFDGKCYVFDHRITVDVNSVNPTLISHCAMCGTPSARYINCANEVCNRHFICCASCSEIMEGCCNNACRHHPKKRRYDGTGFYHKKAVINAPHF
ncbi:MAG: rhodanese-related sulfurtransferase [Chitinophagales bacterium]|nr:rhodanese-related sulfurtransferase [Chitinophagales bacterium]MDW8428049.1 rhodanese-related sulfurtransferase [Chitinophagales bacterium]